MERILPAIREHFVNKREHFIAFARADSRLEGWAKGELIVLLEQLRTRGEVQLVEREANVPLSVSRVAVDFRITLDGATHLCELKMLCISRAAGTPRNLRFYFRDDRLGPVGDFRKLDGIPGHNKWVLGFVYPNPGTENWREVMSGLAADLTHWQCATAPEDFPEHLFLAVWQHAAQRG